MCESLTARGIFESSELVGEFGCRCRCRVGFSIARCSQQQGKHRGEQKPEGQERDQVSVTFGDSLKIKRQRFDRQPGGSTPSYTRARARTRLKGGMYCSPTRAGTRRTHCYGYTRQESARHTFLAKESLPLFLPLLRNLRQALGAAAQARWQTQHLRTRTAPIWLACKPWHACLPPHREEECLATRKLTIQRTLAHKKRGNN